MYRNSLSTCQFVYIVSVSTRAEFIAEIIIMEAHAACHHFSMPIYCFHPLAVSPSRLSSCIQHNSINTLANAYILTFHANSPFYCVSFIIKFKATNYILPISTGAQLENLTKHNKTQSNNRNINYNYSNHTTATATVTASV